MSIYRNGSLWIDGRKWGEMTTYTYDITNNGEDVVNDKGYDGATDGNTASKLATDTIVPLGGDSAQLELAILQRKQIDVTVGPINGKLHTVKMIFKHASHKGDAKNRSNSAAYEATGGEPKMLG